MESTESAIGSVLQIFQRPNNTLEAGIRDALVSKKSEPSKVKAPPPSATIVAEEQQRMAALHSLLQLPQSLEQELAEATAATERANALALDALSTSFARAEVERSSAAGGGGWGAGLAPGAAASAAAQARAQKAGREKAMRALATHPSSAASTFAAEVSRSARETSSMATAAHRACFGDKSSGGGGVAAAGGGSSASAALASFERIARISRESLEQRGGRAGTIIEDGRGRGGDGGGGGGGGKRKGSSEGGKGKGGKGDEDDDQASFLPALARELQAMWLGVGMSEEGRKVLAEVASGFEDLPPLRTKSAGKKERKRKKEKKRKGKGRDKSRDRDRMDVEPTAAATESKAMVNAEQLSGGFFKAPVFESNSLLKKLAGTRRRLEERVESVSALLAQQVAGVLWGWGGGSSVLPCRALPCPALPFPALHCTALRCAAFPCFVLPRATPP